MCTAWARKRDQERKVNPRPQEACVLSSASIAYDQVLSLSGFELQFLPQVLPLSLILGNRNPHQSGGVYILIPGKRMLLFPRE